MNDGPSSRPRRAPGTPWGAPDVGAAGLTRGDVTVVLEPVRDRERAALVLAAVTRIGGVSSAIEETHDGRELVLAVRVGRPVPLASELRRVLPRDFVSCTASDRRFRVVLTDAPARPAAPPPGRRTGELAVPGPIAAATRPARPRPAAGAPAERGVPALDVMVGALQSLTEVSILVFDAELRIRAATGTAHEQFGHAADRLVGLTADEALSELAWGRFRAACAGALAGTTTVLEAESESGEDLYEHTVSPVQSGTLVVGGMIVTRDVSDRRRDQMLITELKEVFELTFDHSPICQALLSPAGQWLRVNPALQELVGRDEPSLVGTDARDLTHPQDRPVEEALMTDLTAGRRSHYGLRKRLLHADGRLVPVDLRMSVVRGEGGAPRGLIAQIVESADAWRAPDRSPAPR